MVALSQKECAMLWVVLFAEPFQDHPHNPQGMQVEDLFVIEFQHHHKCLITVEEL